MQAKDYKLRAQIVKAMAHPSRLLILDALKSNEMTVSELTSLIGADQSTVSKHLSVLKNSGLVCDRKQGTNIYYRLLCPCLNGFMECLEKVVNDNARRYQQQCGYGSQH